MSRIAKKDLTSPEAPATGVQEEVSLLQEEAQLAQTAESSFFAVDVAQPAFVFSRPRRDRDREQGLAARLQAPRRNVSTQTQTQAPSNSQGSLTFTPARGDRPLRTEALAPYLAELQAELPRLAWSDDQELLEQGTYVPALLETIALPVLRRALAALHKDFPEKAFTKQLELAWVARVEAKLYACCEKLEALDLASRQLNRGVMEAPKFFAMWDKHTDSLRYVSSQQNNSANQGAPMGAGEAHFHSECLALLDEYALPMALAKHKNKVPDEHTLRALGARLRLVASFAKAEVRAELVQNPATVANAEPQVD